ncbi:hypothetical protein LTR86_006197 [Recurvomyces mirabilis]|nr:hypothetical protein LTR86_006197 [Recurvomyces mirabilis]
MPPSQGLPPKNSSISPQSSGAPLLPAEQQASDPLSDETDIDERTIDPKTGKRRIFGLELGGKKREEGGARSMESSPAVGSGMLPSTQAAINAMRGPSTTTNTSERKPHPQPIPISPRHPYPSALGAAAASPSRLRSSSPRLHSPASSEIFERSVQEPIPLSNLQDELSPAHIPTHVLTEDHIPPALEASVEAITSSKLGADEVEIVTSSAHQPAGEKVLEGSASHVDLRELHSPSGLRHAGSETAAEMHSSLGQLPSTGNLMEDEGASTYGQLDPNDVRRLSFISFADVVQTEHQQQAATGSSLGELGSKDSLHMASPSSSLPGSFPTQVHEQHAGSPLRSPASPKSCLGGGVTTPPLPGVSINPAADQSPVRSNTHIGSPPGQHGELNIETMRQAVRKTASGDLSGVRNSGLSPISSPDVEGSRSRTNT